MRLTDIIFRFSSVYRNVGTFIRHPGNILAQHGRRIAQNKLEEIEIPVGRDSSRTASKPVERQRSLPAREASPERERWQNRPEPMPSQTRTSTATAVQPALELKPPAIWNARSAEVPLLSEQDQIRGRWGRYRRVGDEVDIGDRVRCYSGILMLNNKPVMIKEYLLFERDFNSREIRERKEKFAALSNLNLRNGGGQDFRLVNVYEAIASPHSPENRCYLISEPIPQSQTLRQSLTAHPEGFTSPQVRHLLGQVLQTLWFLHHQKVRFPSGEVQYGLPHGNLNLDSLLIVPKPLLPDQSIPEDDLQFFIYVTDLAIWEHLFLPASEAPPAPTPAQDLVDLGYLGFTLLTGNTSRPNLLLEHPWETVTDTPLKEFLRQLAGGTFKADAEAARQALMQLPWPAPVLKDGPLTVENVLAQEANHRFLRRLVILGLLGGFLGGVLWLGGRWLVGRSPTPAGPNQPCCLAAIATLPNQPTTYVTEAGGIWASVLRSPHQVALGRTLEHVLQERDPRLQNYTLQTTDADIWTALNTGSAAFALTQWQEDLPEGFEQQEVAYDGLVAVVAFSDGKPSDPSEKPLTSMPEHLAGTLTLEQLRQLYTGMAEPQDLARSLEGWTVKRYVPADPQTVQHFEQTVLGGDRADIQRFRDGAIAPLPINQMFSEILKDFEERNTLGIGFARLSQVINQCSVYPLALGEGGQEVQPLAQSQGGAIDPATDLCGDKGSYAANVRAFVPQRGVFPQHYPLRYRLAVVYRQDSEAGRSFAAALKTEEGQHLLNAAGLVPIRPLSR